MNVAARLATPVLLRIGLLGLLPSVLIAAPSTTAPATDQRTADVSADLIRNAATEQKLLTSQFTDGGLAPVVGVQNIEVFRASRGAPDLTDGKGWTYNHHVDMACWKGRLFIAWD